MRRYIDADALKKSVEGLTDCYNGFSDTYDKACIIGLIDEEPTVDAVKVVRCADCKHWDGSDPGSTQTPDWGKCKRIRQSKPPFQFCCYGERREVTE